MTPLEQVLRQRAALAERYAAPWLGHRDRELEYGLRMRALLLNTAVAAVRHGDEYRATALAAAAEGDAAALDGLGVTLSDVAQANGMAGLDALGWGFNPIKAVKKAANWVSDKAGDVVGAVAQATRYVVKPIGKVFKDPIKELKKLPGRVYRWNPVTLTTRAILKTADAVGIDAAGKADAKINRGVVYLEKNPVKTIVGSAAAAGAVLALPAVVGAGAAAAGAAKAGAVALATGAGKDLLVKEGTKLAIDKLAPGGGGGGGGFAPPVSVETAPPPGGVVQAGFFSNPKMLLLAGGAGALLLLAASGSKPQPTIVMSAPVSGYGGRSRRRARPRRRRRGGRSR